MASESKEISQTIEAAPHTSSSESSSNIMSISNSMLVLTWIAFTLTMIVLYKFAWKPIFAILDKREAEIRKAVENAAKLKEDLAKINDERARVIAEADVKAGEIIDRARKAAVETANVIEKKARNEIVILQENAEREIKATHEKALASLKRDIAEMAVTMAERVMKENTDKKCQNELVEKLIREI